MSATRWTLLTMVMMVGTILTTYAFWLAHGGKWFLPTISATWEAAPGSYISRFFAEYSCDFLYFTAFFMYAARKTARQANEWEFRFSDEALFYMTVFAIFMLSWVPPICDSDKPSCRGNGTIHSICAVTFFVLYDIYMVIETCQTAHLLTVFESWSKLILVVVSVISKIRWLPQMAPASNGFPTTAVVEWIDVACIAVFTASYVRRHCGSIRVSIIQSNQDGENRRSAAGEPSSTLQISARKFRGCGVGLAVAVLAVSLVAGLANGTLPKGRVPFISDMWVYQPGDWVSRWGMIGVSFCGIWSQIMLYFASTGDESDPAALRMQSINAPSRAAVGTSESPTLMLVLALVSFLGLSVVSVVDESENLTIHGISAGVFFGAYGVYMAVSLCFGTHRSRGKLVVLFLVFCATKIRFLPESVVGANANWLNIAAILEWTDALAIIAYMWFDIFSRPETSGISLAVLEDKSGEFGGDQDDEAKQLYGDYTAILG